MKALNPLSFSATRPGVMPGLAVSSQSSRLP